MTADFDTLIEAGLRASSRDDLDGALHAWQAAAALSPGSAIPHFLMAAEYAQVRRLVEAEAAYANAVVLAPEFETARYQLGLLQFTSGRPAVAQVTWEPLYRLAEGHPIREFVLGFAALAQDDFDTALHCFASGIGANHGNAAMNADITQVVTAIHRLRAPASEKAEAEAGAAEDAHFLLAAYRQQTSLQ